MNYIDLNHITQAHVEGIWTVEAMNGPGLAHSTFSAIHRIAIQKNAFTAQNGKEISGQFIFCRENEIVYNPQLKFYQHNKEVGNAIITRLYSDIENNKTCYKLTLYFSTGLELILQKN
ncbi:MAG: hypothetical protein JWO32_591 [Bacteroidetes bacterium]|nr:hypothetical protein [Bacteroidota bacterium]